MTIGGMRQRARERWGALIVTVGSSLVCGCSLDYSAFSVESGSGAAATGASGTGSSSAGGTGTGAGGSNRGGLGNGGAGVAGAGGADMGGAGMGGAAPIACDPPDVLRVDDGHCYRFFGGPLTFPNAQAACVAWRAGGSLVTVNDSSETNFILQQVKPGGIDAIIGLNDLENLDDEFTWVSGEASNYDGWEGSQPNHSFMGNDEDVAAYWLGQNVWHDIPVSVAIGYLCEAPS